VSRYGVQLIVIDYIQLMRVDGSENRTNEIARDLAQPERAWPRS